MRALVTITVGTLSSDGVAPGRGEGGQGGGVGVTRRNGALQVQQTPTSGTLGPLRNGRRLRSSTGQDILYFENCALGSVTIYPSTLSHTKKEK